MNILMVCLGNICRSPLAEGILKSKVDNSIVYVDSAGTSGFHIGESPDKRSIRVAIKHGIDLTYQKSRQFTREDFDKFDLIYAMDNSNKANIIALSRNQNDVDKVRLILNEIKPNKNLNVPDPYYGGEQGFENVFKMLDNACDEIAKKL